MRKITEVSFNNPKLTVDLLVESDDSENYDYLDDRLHCVFCISQNAKSWKQPKPNVLATNVNTFTELEPESMVSFIKSVYNFDKNMLYKSYLENHK